MKNNLFKKFLAVFLTGTMLTGVGCKDYDDDIDKLNNRIDETNATVSQLKELIEKGSVITSVTKTDEGLTFTLSNGQTYNITNGTSGKDAVVWKIGTDGYWYKDDVKTEYKAVGVDGPQGPQGPTGPTGPAGSAGANGVYYVPNIETGCFDIYKDGVKQEATEISWKASGLSATLNGNVLTLVGVAGAEGPVTILQGVPLGSLAVVPNVISDELPYPIAEFFYLPTYLSDAKFVSAGDKTFVAQKWDKSNEVALVYRMSPTNAFVDGAVAAFVNRNVTTRALAGDKADLLNVISYKYAEDNSGAINVLASINLTKASTTDVKDIAALQVWAGQNPVTSDYIQVDASEVNPLLVDSIKTKATGSAVEFYNRTKAIAKAADETEAFIKAIVALDAPANLEFKYDGEIDLKKYVGLYSDKNKFLFDLGFKGMTYTFSLPAEYKAEAEATTNQTNQQWFVELNNGVVKANSKNLSTGLTPAIGRTPVVRVDAFLPDNAGVAQMVASAYIKLSILKNDPTVEDKDDNEVTIAPDKSLNYRALTATATTAGEMTWQKVNTDIYGVEGLTATNFWENYEPAYSVKITSIDKTTGKPVTVLEGTGSGSDNEFTATQDGITIVVNLNKSEVTTSGIKVSVDNNVKTQHTYKDVDNKGAEYTVTVNIASKDKKQHGDFILTQKFYVLEAHTPFVFNPLYHFLPAEIKDTYPAFSDKTQNDIIIVKGQLSSGSNTWVMSSKVSEHFGKVDSKDIFTYYTAGNNAVNVTGVSFTWTKIPAEGVTPTEAQTADFEVALDGALTKEFLTKDMTYTTTLVNAETCPFDYSIVFVNPFVKGAAETVKLYGNAAGEVTAATDVQVLVNDREKDAIYKYVGESTNALALTEKATNTYKVAAPTVAYAFDTTEADYKELAGNISAGSTFEVNASTGVVTWKNEGATLKRDYNVTVIATVTFENLSKVECRIPVTITAAN